MNFLARLFSLGRLLPAPQGDRGGHFLLPAGAQRAHLDLKSYDAPTGCVQTSDNQWRCVAEVTGYPLHARSEADATAVISRIVVALNALPGKLVMLSRSVPGGLEKYVIERKARAQSGEAGPMRRLLEDQSRHALARMDQGRYRTTQQFLCTAGGSAREAQQLMLDTIDRLSVANTTARIVTSNALAQYIAESWRPASVEHFVLDFNGPDGDVLASLAYSPDFARVTKPRFGRAVTGAQHKAMTDAQRKALVG